MQPAEQSDCLAAETQNKYRAVKHLEGTLVYFVLSIDIKILLSLTDSGGSFT